MVHDFDAPEDDEMLARQAIHDAEAFSELYRRYLDRVYRYLLSRVGIVQDAQDLTSQTFIAAWESIGNYQAQGVFAAWLFGIARRKAVDYFRGSRAVVALEEVEDVAYETLSLDILIEQRLDLEQVARCLRTISPDRAEALSLRVFGGLSAAETARIMGRNEDAVHTLVYRALRDLRQEMVSKTEVQS